ncbi:hypothetical protein OAE63_00855 [bacterium]|jgi:TolA-binding protein|nr:hypothetical protein [bacterium]
MSNAWGRSVLVLVFAAVCAIAVAQEKPQDPTTNSERGATSVSRETVKGRLPRYFASLVNSDQRIEIYLIQANFRDQISKLKQQLEKLETKQMQDIEAVLTTDQREKLLNFRNSSRKKRTTDPGVGDRPTRDEATNDSPDPASSAKNPTSSTSNQ